MIGPRFRLARRLAAFVALLSAANAVADGDFVAAVYSDDAITIHAGLAGDSRRIVQFGDLLTMVVTVAYDSGAVSIQKTDDEYFAVDWADAAAVVLVDQDVRHGSGSGRQQKQLRAKLRFQVLGCPGEQVTCPEDRTYPLPKITLVYQDLSTTEADIATESVVFQPWPATLSVSTTLARDEENQLHPFQTYFPTGGYPDPLTGKDSTGASILAAGFALAVLTGGMLMWPFRSRTQKESAAQAPRWHTLLNELRNADKENEGQYLDALRRCLVWYCNDELHIDPFVWLDLAERSDDAGSDAVNEQSYSEFRSLFVELLHNPVGRGPELQTRLEGLTGQSRTA